MVLSHMIQILLNLVHLSLGHSVLLLFSIRITLQPQRTFLLVLVSCLVGMTPNSHSGGVRFPGNHTLLRLGLLHFPIHSHNWETKRHPKGYPAIDTYFSMLWWCHRALCLLIIMVPYPSWDQGFCPYLILTGHKELKEFRQHLWLLV